MKTEKLYPISNSPLYRLKSRKKLIEILDIKNYASLNKFIENPEKHYNQFSLFSTKGKLREIKEPIGRMRVIHQKVAKLLSRVETPEYLMSQKGCSYKDNAEFHKDTDNNILTTDIRNFFPSCRRERIAFSFKKHFGMPGDIAFLLSKLLTFQDRIPQGSSASNLLSFWSNYSMFEHINEFCLERSFRFSLYVDDITVSASSKIKKNDIRKICKILEKNGFEIKKEKTKYFKKGQVKHITGVALKKGEILLEHSKKKKFFRLLNEKKPKNISSLEGMLHYCRSIEPNFVPTISVQTIKREVITNVCKSI